MGKAFRIARTSNRR